MQLLPDSSLDHQPSFRHKQQFLFAQQAEIKEHVPDSTKPEHMKHLTAQQTEPQQSDDPMAKIIRNCD